MCDCNYLFWVLQLQVSAVAHICGKNGSTEPTLSAQCWEGFKNIRNRPLSSTGFKQRSLWPVNIRKTLLNPPPPPHPTMCWPNEPFGIVCFSALGCHETCLDHHQSPEGPLRRCASNRTHEKNNLIFPVSNQTQKSHNATKKLIGFVC